MVPVIRKVYIAGPMSGIPAFNYPAFHSLEKSLRLIVLAPKVHMDVINPAAFGESSPEALAAIMASPDGDPSVLYPYTRLTWGDYLARSVKLIGDDPDLDAIVTLPGWDTSRGSRIETFIGHVRGLKIVDYHFTYDNRITLHEHPRSALIRAWEGDIYAEF